MTDWKDIHPDFTDELQAQWEQFGLNPEEVEEWIEVGLKPKEFDLFFHIQSEDYEIDDIKNDMEQGGWLLDELRREFYENKKESKESEGEIETRVAKRRRTSSPERDWTNIDSNFTPELIKKWKDYGFDWEETKDWIDTGMKVDDAGFCAWLRDEVEVDSDRVLNYENIEDLQEQYQEYLSVNHQIQTDHYFF